MNHLPSICLPALRALLLSCALAGSWPGLAWAQPAPVLGQGPGYHDPRSPFKPLQEQEGVLSWSLLSSVTTKADKTRLIPIFPAAVRALDKKTVRVQGFMMPLEPGDKQRHFLLSSVPTSCSFCVPAGPEGLIEVRSKQPVRYSLEPVLVEGVLAVLSDDAYGLFYRLAEGQALAYKP
ncbi:hypothetical protein HNP55_000009 [Paucibacter oligotrophus]|uniref:DUF3299 domain-containing protein n=1 Tax=Roseateles oligotrophus TaxID=1769250 RepID=A0A840KZ70_9BURK|nr:DUF3299 domain-containing protein [Roseateles oligotrophus]MBB4841514.1 hypothetical protein [Roseateles oligotrophus]